VRHFLRNNGLSLAAFGLFLLFVVGQVLAGHRVYNEDQVEHGEAATSIAGYLSTSHFGEAIFENWESEFLQMGGYVLLTVWLRQRGSAESKKLDEAEPVDEDPAKHKGDTKAPWPVRRGGLALALYRNSLSAAFLGCFALSWLLHAVTGGRAYSAEQQAHGEAAVSTLQYMARSQFWFESFQNWQSEFLAVGAIVVLSIFLRQQGSPESKPVHAPNAQTGE
jgi:hypothetical protein